MSSQEAHADQRRLEELREEAFRKESEKEKNALAKSEKKRERQLMPKEKNKSLLAREGEIRKALYCERPIFVLMCKGACLITNDTNSSLPSIFVALLQDFNDVFPEEIPSGLPPIRGIEHQIDFIPGASIPNRLAYRTNPSEAKEIQTQVEELLTKGYVRESLSPCSVPVILVPKKDETWRMCVDC